MQAFNVIVKKLNIAESKGQPGEKKDVRLDCLRKAFRKFMAASIDSRYVEFWTGHTNIETHYLSTDPAHHRQLYAKGHLCLGRPSVDVETVSKLRMSLTDLGERTETRLAEDEEKEEYSIEASVKELAMILSLFLLGSETLD